MIFILVLIFILLIVSIAWSIYYLYFKKNVKLKSEYHFPKTFNFWELKNNDWINVNQLLIIAYSEYNDNKVNLVTAKDGHGIVLGGSGTGKTERWVGPMIKLNSQTNLKPSMIVTDFKSSEGIDSSLYLKYKNHLKENGYKIFNLNLDHKLFENFKFGENTTIPSFSFNPLDEIYNNIDNDLILDSKIESFLDFVFTEETNNEKEFWNISAKIFVKAFIYFMIEEKFEYDYFNLENLLNLLTLKFNNVIELIEENKEKYIESFKAYSLFAKNPDSKKSTSYDDIKKTIATKIDFFNDKLIRVISSKTNIEVNRDEPIAIFIQLSGDNKNHLKFASLFIHQITRILEEMNSKDSKDWLLLLDEFNSLSKIPFFAEKLEKSRSVKIWWFPILQSLERIKNRYGMMSGFLENFFHTIILNSITDEQIKLLVGGYLQENEIESFTTSNSGHRSSSVSERKEEMFLSKELKNLKDNKAIIRTRGYNPFKTILNFPNFQFKNLSKEQSFNSFNFVSLKEIPKIKKQVNDNNEIDIHKLKKQVNEIFKSKKIMSGEEISKFNDEREKTDGPLHIGYWKLVNRKIRDLYLNESIDNDIVDEINKKIYHIVPEKFKSLFESL